MIYYYTDDHKFFNPYAMFIYAAENTPHTFPKLYFYDYEFDQLDWKVEPSETWEELLEARARQLREKYDYLALAYSGGTDSQTIFRVFKKLNLHLDEIAIGYHNDPVWGHAADAVDWLLRNSYDPTTKITVQCKDDVPAHIIDVTNELIVDPKNTFTYHAFTSTGTIIRNVQQSPAYLRARSAAVITGHEKPLVMFHDGKWKTTHIDKGGFFEIMGNDGVEMFFISPAMPKLHLKQTHMLKRFAETVVKPTTYWHSSEFFNQSTQHQALAGIWTGRDPSTSLLNQVNQKKFWRENRYHVKTLTQSLAVNSSPILTANNAHTGVRRFLDKLKLVQTDSSIIGYLSRMGLLPASEDVDLVHGIYSKMYALS